MESKYLIGSLSTLKDLYPDHDFDHARKSLDGLQCVIELEIDEDTTIELESQNVLVATHEEALAILNGKNSEGVWYQKIEMPIAPPVVEPIPEPDHEPSSEDSGDERP